MASAHRPDLLCRFFIGFLPGFTDYLSNLGDQVGFIYCGGQGFVFFPIAPRIIVLKYFSNLFFGRHGRHFNTQMPVRTIRSPTYNPTLPRSGSTNDYAFRMSNLIKRGRGDSAYYEVGGMPESLSEPLTPTALTGTLAITLNSTVVTGTGTAFTTELHLGQMFFIVDTTNHKTHPCVVERIVSATSVVMSLPATFTISGMVGYRLPVIFAVDNQRGTCLRGNVVKVDKGTLFSVGDGTFRLDGSPISATLALTKAPKVSILTAGTYAHYTLGMSTPATPAAADVAGGVKGMLAANYSIRITAERLATLGFNNPSERADVTLATTGHKIEITFPTADTAKGQDAWGVWGTRYVDSQDTSGQNTVNGPWFRVGQVAESALTAHKYSFEWLDGEIETRDAGLGGSLLTFDNDAPPDAEFVEMFNGVPVWISCSGVGDTSPGPFIRPAKPSNVEAAPAEMGYPTSPPEQIIGALSANARIYLMTTNRLQIAQPTANDLQPVRVSPFWKAGFKNPYQLVFVNGMLYGMTTAGPSRSVGEGDEQESEKTWAADINEYSKAWITGHVLVAHDPLNDAICFFHSAYNLNATGFWTTRVWMWGVQQQEWVGDITLDAVTGDCIVSGVATVGNHLEFIMGGRLSGDTTYASTYRFDTGAVATDYYIAGQFIDYSSEDRPHVVKLVRITGKLTQGSIKVYGAGPTQAIPVADLEAGTNSLASVNLASMANVTQSEQVKFNVKGLAQSTVRVAGRWNGLDARDRIDETTVAAEIMGARR